MPAISNLTLAALPILGASNNGDNLLAAADAAAPGEHRPDKQGSAKDDGSSSAFEALLALAAALPPNAVVPAALTGNSVGVVANARATAAGGQDATPAPTIATPVTADSASGRGYGIAQTMLGRPQAVGLAVSLPTGGQAMARAAVKVQQDATGQALLGSPDGSDSGVNHPSGGQAVAHASDSTQRMPAANAVASNSLPAEYPTLRVDREGDPPPDSTKTPAARVGTTPPVLAAASDSSAPGAAVAPAESMQFGQTAYLLKTDPAAADTPAAPPESLHQDAGFPIQAQRTTAKAAIIASTAAHDESPTTRPFVGKTAEPTDSRANAEPGLLPAKPWLKHQGTILELPPQPDGTASTAVDPQGSLKPAVPALNARVVTPSERRTPAIASLRPIHEPPISSNEQTRGTPALTRAPAVVATRISAILASPATMVSIATAQTSLPDPVTSTATAFQVGPSHLGLLSTVLHPPLERPAHRATAEQQEPTAERPDTSSPEAKEPMKNGETRSMPSDTEPVLPVSFVSMIAGQRTVAAAAIKPLPEPMPSGKQEARDGSAGTGMQTTTAAVGTVAAHAAIPATAPLPAAQPQPNVSSLTTQVAHGIIDRAEAAIRDGRTDFRMHLHPPELGAVQIHLSASDHTVTARLVVASEATQRMLEGGWQDLRQNLADAGITLVSFDVSHQGSGFQSRQQAPEQRPGQTEIDAIGPRVGRRPVGRLGRARGRIDVLA